MTETKIIDFDTIWGKAKIECRIGTNDTLVAESVMVYDEYKASTISYKDGDKFIDIGSHIGTWSILMAIKNPSFQIYSYEAIPDNYELILRNIQHNQLSNVHPFLLAISDVSGKTVEIFHTSEETPFGSQHRFVGTMWGTGHSYKTKTISLSDALIENKIDKVKVIKTDCEGCELKGFASLIPEQLKTIDYVVGEYHPYNMGMEDFYGMFKPYFNRVLPPHGNELQNFIFKNKEV